MKKISGLPKGVVKNHHRYAATYILDNRKYYLGTFDTAEDASAAYVKARTTKAEGLTPTPTPAHNKRSKSETLEYKRAQNRKRAAIVADIALAKSLAFEAALPFSAPNVLWTTNWI